MLQRGYFHQVEYFHEAECTGGKLTPQPYVKIFSLACSLFIIQLVYTSWTSMFNEATFREIPPAFLGLRKRYIIDAWQGSEYSTDSEYIRILNMPVLHKVLKKCSTIDAWNDSEYSSSFDYGRVLNMPGLHKVLSKTFHYRHLTGFWICF